MYSCGGKMDATHSTHTLNKLTLSLSGPFLNLIQGGNYVDEMWNFGEWHFVKTLRRIWLSWILRIHFISEIKRDQNNAWIFYKSLFVFSTCSVNYMVFTEYKKTQNWSCLFLLSCPLHDGFKCTFVTLASSKNQDSHLNKLSSGVQLNMFTYFSNTRCFSHICLSYKY